jgi:hypothetical protein
MLRRLNRVESNKWNCHGKYSTQYVEYRVRDVNSKVEFVCEDNGDHKNWDDVNDEAVTTPRGHHIEILQYASD